MNEQITKLADKAIEDMPRAWNIPDEFCEKFAQLIVKECASIVYKTDTDHADGLALLLLHTFGVEE